MPTHKTSKRKPHYVLVERKTIYLVPAKIHFNYKQEDSSYCVRSHGSNIFIGKLSSINSVVNGEKIRYLLGLIYLFKQKTS